MLVQKTTGSTVTSFKDQAFFNNFHWSNFDIGDIIFLQDYNKSDCQKELGIFQGIKEGNVVIRLIPHQYEATLLRNGTENINQMADKNFWSRFIK